MKFEQALQALKEGEMVRRSAWHQEISFVFRQAPSIINRDIVPKMTSLPDSVKREFERRFEDPNFQMNEIYYNNQLAIVSFSNLISGYSPSVEDVFAEDWEIVNNIQENA